MAQQIKITQTSNADMNIGIPKKMTAVEWLVEQLKEYDFSDIKDNEYYILKIPAWILNQKEEQAKQIEKEQIMDAYYYEPNTDEIKDDGEKYYNETYNK